MAAVGPAGSNPEINALARRAGLPYTTSISAALAARYGLVSGVSLDNRWELYDLMWAVTSAINGCLPAHCERTRNGHTFRVEFFSLFAGVAEPVAVSVSAALDTSTQPARLHLSLTDEIPDPVVATVLIVEADELISQLLCVLLQRGGLKASVAGTAREALQNIGQNTPDLVMLDSDLPDTDGLALLAQLQDNPATASIPVVFCSAHHDQEARVFECGAVAFLKKPLGLLNIAERLRELLKQKH